MSFEKPNIPESSETRTEKYYNETLRMAQKLSERWQVLREKTKENPNLLAAYPKLEQVDSLSKPPVSGIQSYFEGQVESINKSAGDADARSRMIYRLKEDLQEIEKELDEVLK